jgi:hypothetical protein
MPAIPSVTGNATPSGSGSPTFVQDGVTVVTPHLNTPVVNLDQPSPEASASPQASPGSAANKEHAATRHGAHAGKHAHANSHRFHPSRIATAMKKFFSSLLP